MEGSNHHVVFTLDEQRYALSIARVERIVRAVEVTPLPWAPEVILGVINVHGRMIPVFNVRRRLGLPERDVDPSDQFMIVNAGQCPAVLVVDAVVDVTDCAVAHPEAGAEVVPGVAVPRGLAKGDESWLLVHDLHRFLSLDEEQTLATALQPTVGAAG